MFDNPKTMSGTVLGILCMLLIHHLVYVNGDVSDNEVKQTTCNLDEGLVQEIRSYEPVVRRIIKEALKGQYSDTVYEELARFVDHFGPRMAGTDNLEKAIDYMLDLSKKKGFDNVHGEEASVPYWIRGNESAALLKPRYQKLRMLGLGTSVATPPEGISAEVIVVDSFDQLHQFADKVKGKIVVFNPPWKSYGETVQYRVRGASESARLGAVAALVRSVTPISLDTPHTGHQEYEQGVPQVPVACITPADANMLARMQARGEKIVIQLHMEGRNAGWKTSRNTVAEVEGSSASEKVVVVSGHLDSWDVGQGAMDDAAGAFLSWGSALLLRNLNLTPRRTIRVILWTGEEQGYVGAAHYVKQHSADIDKLDFVMESDSGTFTPVGLELSGTPEAACILQEILRLLSPVNATSLRQPQDGGPDISIWTNMGVPGVSLWTKNEQYYWYHHSPADTMDVESPKDLQLCTALWASVAYVVADLSIDIPKNLTAPSHRFLPR